MTCHPSLPIASGLALALFAAAVLAQAARGLDFRTYLSIQRGMTEGQVLSMAGPPDLQADEGVAFSNRISTQDRAAARTALAAKTYTYLPTEADPYTTTVTFVGGQLTEIQRDGKTAPVQAARGLDFRTYLSLQRGMTEGEALAIAGPPDMQADQGVVFSAQGHARSALAVRTYTYLPTTADPHTTTIAFAGGRVTDIRRDRKF
jgi:hypothetical protein